MSKTKLNCNGIKRFLIVLLFFTIIHSSLILCSGQLSWWNAWAFTGEYLFLMLIVFIVMLKINPGLLNERGKKHKNTKTFDKIILFIYSILFLLLPIIAGFDKRFNITNISDIASIIAIILSIPIFSFVMWAFIVNNYFETTIRIQDDRGHKVCDVGPYKFIRHPTYLATILGFIIIPFILGSLLSLIPSSLMAIIFIIRTYYEDNTLKKELKGYKEYIEKTRYRLIPGIW